MTAELRVPNLGESIAEATVGNWFKAQGEEVSADEIVCELETDKVTVEVPAPEGPGCCRKSPPRRERRSRSGICWA